jgi:hypothetical protein
VSKSAKRWTGVAVSADGLNVVSPSAGLRQITAVQSRLDCFRWRWRRQWRRLGHQSFRTFNLSPGPGSHRPSALARAWSVKHSHGPTSSWAALVVAFVKLAC